MHNAPFVYLIIQSSSVISVCLSMAHTKHQHKKSALKGSHLCCFDCFYSLDKIKHCCEHMILNLGQYCTYVRISLGSKWRSIEWMVAWSLTLVESHTWKHNRASVHWYYFSVLVWQFVFCLNFYQSQGLCV